MTDEERKEEDFYQKAALALGFLLGASICAMVFAFAGLP